MADGDASWVDWQPPILMPHPIVRFHKVIENGEVIDTLAVLADGSSVSLTTLLGDAKPDC